MVDLDGIKISVPNQKLITNEIVDLGKKEIIRRHVTVTPSFSEDRHKVEKTLIEAIKRALEILEEPAPYVWINNF
jgi:small-conductance mechanosensitive channel